HSPQLSKCQEPHPRCLLEHLSSSSQYTLLLQYWDIRRSSISAPQFTHSKPSAVPGTQHTLSARTPQFFRQYTLLPQYWDLRRISISAPQFTNFKPSA
ncbi:hypothetical protein NDU88_001011, partial [Pleurodeles waltl]